MKSQALLSPKLKKMSSAVVVIGILVMQMQLTCEKSFFQKTVMWHIKLKGMMTRTGFK